MELMTMVERLASIKNNAMSRSNTEGKYDEIVHARTKAHLLHIGIE